MDEMEITQPEEIIEASDEPEAEEQSLEDATYEADAHVEQSGDFEQSEQVETAITDIVDTLIEEPAQASEQESQIARDIDPDTGESKPSGSAPAETSVEEEDPIVLDEGQGENEPPDEGLPEAVKEEDNLGKSDEEADVASDAADARRDGEVYEEDMDSVIVTNDTTESQTATVEHPVGIVNEGDFDADQLEPPQIERHLPEEEILAEGLGKHGLIPGAVDGKKLPGGGGDYPGLGKGTSGGGPPVGGSGVGSKGETSYYIHRDRTDGTESDQSGGTSASCQSTKDHVSDIATMSSNSGESGKAHISCEDGTEYFIYWDEKGIEVSKGYLVDGNQPMPFTGSYGDGDGLPPDTSHKPPQGPDREANFLQMVAGGGMDPKAYFGYGSSGSSTFSPSGGSDEDDSGHFYGGLSGGDRWGPSPDPDDWDYYTPNILAEALAKKREE